MSPPLYMIIAVAVLTLLAFRRDRWGKVGVGGLTICGLLFSIGALVEPILFEIFKPEQFDFFKAVIEIGMIIIPLVMMVLGVREWKSRHSTP
jgi:phosphatidylserine synthase